MANYYEQVTAMRRSKQQEEIALERNQAIRGYELSLQNRQEIEREAATTNDPDEQQRLRDMWHYYDAELQRCEADIRRFTPPAPPDPRAVEYMRRRQPFINKYGQRAIQAFDLAHQHLASTGNWKIGSPRYYKALDTLLEMYGPDHGIKFDPNEIALTPNEAAKISGLSPERYNQAVRAVHAARKFSYQEKK